MNRVLLLCSTKCSHNFSNLKSFKGHYDKFIIYDTGLTETNKQLIRINSENPIFIKGSFNGDFSLLRNNALSYIDNGSKVIFIDDSYELISGNLEPDTLQKLVRIYDSQDYNNSVSLISICFIKDLETKYESPVHEYRNKVRITRSEPTAIIRDISDIKRTKERLISDIYQLENYDQTPRTWFYLGKLYSRINKKKALYYFSKRINVKYNDEEKFMALLYVFYMTRNINCLYAARIVWPDRILEVNQIIDILKIKEGTSI